MSGVRLNEQHRRADLLAVLKKLMDRVYPEWTAQDKAADLITAFDQWIDAKDRLREAKASGEIWE